MFHRLLLASSLLSVTILAGCASDGDDTPTAPAAPSALAAEPLGGGAHLTWTDNADNETEFMVMRMADGETDYTTVATVPFDTTAYHDAPLTAGTTYMFMVMAMNDTGESESNEVEFTAP